jgi:type VI secretion system ImpJ/VasE family protein
MRFEEMVHWNDGQFLQPHHFQYLQRLNLGYIRQNRNFSLPYPYGIVDFELEREALTGARVSIRHFSAIMSDGLEISMPGNCILRPLDLTPALKQYPNELTIYIAVPLWSEYEANLADEANPLEKKLYLTEKKRSRDENSGDNEISLITRRINARLITNLDDAKDMQILPILQLNIMTHDKAESVVAIDEKYAPPFILLTSDSPVFDMAQGLIVDIQRCRNKILNTLTQAKFRPETFSGENGHSLLNLRVLSLYETRLSSLLVSGHIAPFDLYLELSSLLAELMGFNPMNGVREI